MPAARISRKAIEDLKVIFNLRDWDITCRVSRVKKADCRGYVISEWEYKKAAITIHTEIIKQSKDGETPFKVLVHEFAEIVVSEYLGTLHPAQRETEKMMEYRDRVADHINRIVIPYLRLLGYPV